MGGACKDSNICSGMCVEVRPGMEARPRSGGIGGEAGPMTSFVS